MCSSIKIYYKANFTTYGSKGREWILCKIVSLSYQLQNINTLIKNRSDQKKKNVVHYFVFLESLYGNKIGLGKLGDP